jgi:hypothetical protein
MYLTILKSVSESQPQPQPLDPRGDRSKSKKLVSKALFRSACQQSLLPLSIAEEVMLAELLSRATKTVGTATVDVSLLNKIKRGEFINAPLQ